MKGLALKFWAGMTALIAGMLVLLWVFQVVSLQRVYVDEIMSQINEDAEYLADCLSRNESDEFMSSASTLAYTKNISVQAYVTESLCIFNTESATPSPSSMASSSAFKYAVSEALSGREYQGTISHPKFGTNVAVRGIPYRYSDGTYGALMISASLAPVNTTVNIIQRQLIITTVVLLALALIISFIISRTLTKPILRIEKATKRIAEGDYSVKLDVDSNDEIGSLAESVNDMAAELSRTDELRKDLIANVSHDLRTPLSLIRGYAETLRDVTGDNKEKRERQLGIIIDETERLDRIVSDMLDLSKLQSGSITVSPAPFDVRRAFGDIISRYDDLSAKSGVTAAAECEDGLSAVGDLPRLEQVFYNLINNAFNHTKEGGKITLAAAKNGELIRFSVTDTGSGISKEDLPHIFDRYYKGEAGVRKIVGTGLGLAIVKNILEAHHAVYGVDSTVGVGTTFWFDLPAAEK
ncbi:MAG: HAMP domain-containing histidine kinase [Clostridia bacterium]|nr:HAMP domain-containing histidine kinase [Clostridia bacterium]